MELRCCDCCDIDTLFDCNVQGSLDLSPYLYVLPLELAPFRDLLATLGAQEAFSGPQYAAMLSDLAQKSGGQPLSPPQLTQALAVSQALADVVGASGGGATSGGGAGGKTLGVLLIPDEEGILRPVGELAYNDAPWLDGSSGAVLCGAGCAKNSNTPIIDIFNLISETFIISRPAVGSYSV